MAIVTYEFYTQVYCGEAIAECQFPQYANRAERQIVNLTHGRAAEYAALPAFQQTAIQYAICAQIEYLFLEGKEITVNGNSSGGWSVGKVRVDKGGSGSKASAASTMICAGAIAELEQTGLLNPQVPVVSDPTLISYPWGVI